MEPLMGTEGMYDGALMGILQNCGKLQPFLDSIFSFLARRTDFYIIMQHEKARMGFPPGVAESMVRTAFKKYEILTRKREAEIMREEETRRIEQMLNSSSSGTTPAITTDSSQMDDELPITLPGNAEPPEPKKEKSPKPDETKDKPTTPATTSDSPPKPKPSEGAPKPASASPPKAKEKTEESPESKKKKKEKQEAFNLSSDTYNGAVMENYQWSQTITDIDIRVPVPEGTTVKGVKVDIKSDHLKVVLLRPEQRVVIDERLLHRVKVEDSMWSLDGETNTICINLEKSKEIMWKSVLEGEEGIDLTKVDNTRKVSEFDEEAQAAIERVQYDHRMKMMGKPTSSDKKAHDILKKAWDAEGSPFKGTPFDPSKVQISGTW